MADTAINVEHTLQASTTEEAKPTRLDAKILEHLSDRVILKPVGVVAHRLDEQVNPLLGRKGFPFLDVIIHREASHLKRGKIDYAKGVLLAFQFIGAVELDLHCAPGAGR